MHLVIDRGDGLDIMLHIYPETVEDVVACWELEKELAKHGVNADAVFFNDDDGNPSVGLHAVLSGQWRFEDGKEPEWAKEMRGNKKEGYLGRSGQGTVTP
jgi:hypothetical protein